MPTSTWQNLDPAKRERILVAALGEFALRGYTAGSLNAIARAAKVAKGSLFQYFDDKLDLWATVVEYGSERMCADLTEGRDARTGRAFSEQLHALVDDWLCYCLTRPPQQSGALAIAREPDQAARGLARQISSSHIERLVEPVLQLGRESGALRTQEPSLVTTQLILLLRHLATAPFQMGEDPTLDLTFFEEAQVRGVAQS